MNSTIHSDLRSIVDNFQIYGDYVRAEPYGNGHINSTYCVQMNQGGSEVRYIVQRINHAVFKDPPMVQSNISRVLKHAQNKLREKRHPQATRHAMTLITTRDDKPYYRDTEGDYWRCYIFVEDATGYDIIENETQAFEAASAFGEFQNLLTDLPGERLHETIANFHDTPARYQHFQDAIAADAVGRVAAVSEEIDFFEKREAIAGHLLKLHRQGLIPERITHNDTKLNNVLLDNLTDKGICVIDLDTCMPGLALYDFGDLVRSSTSPAAEDETDLSKVHMQMNMFEALLRGYLSSAGNFLNEHELANLAFAGKLITYEVGLRFLTDYLEGDPYFKTKYPQHNLDRCRTQMALVKSIETQQNEMQDMVTHCLASQS